MAKIIQIATKLYHTYGVDAQGVLWELEYDEKERPHWIEVISSPK